MSSETSRRQSCGLKDNGDMFAQVSVAYPLPTPLDYIIPEHLHPFVKPGTPVIVPFRNKKATGLVMHISTKSEIETQKLKPIIDVIDQALIIPKELRQLCLWASRYYHHPIGEITTLTLPSLLRKTKAPIQPKLIEHWQIASLDKIIALRKNSKQAEVIELLKKYPEGLRSTVLNEMGFSRAILKALQKKGYIESKFFSLDSLEKSNKNTVEQLVDKEESHSKAQNTAPLPLNEEQQQAFNSIKQKLDEFVPFVLDGVTGSGKTELYLQVIAQVIKNKKQALILVPEIALTPQTVSRFQKRFANTQIAIFHSGLSEKKRYENWRLSLLGHASIIIGTRSALFVPTQSLGLIVIDEAHDQSFKQQDNFRYSARDLALKRAQINGIPIIMGSATHSLATLHQVQNKKFPALYLKKRTNNIAAPEIEMVDMRKQKAAMGLSTKTVAAIEKHLAQGNQVLLFLNRRGFASTLLCPDCAWVAECTRCDAKLTLHLDPERLYCHHCLQQKKRIYQCPNCQCSLVATGLGTERIEQQMSQYFGQYPIIRIDSDAIKNQKHLIEVLNSINQGHSQLIIGTQMLSKGHHFPNLTLVCLINVDHGLCSPDFKAIEHVGQLITQVAGRAGRSSKPGQVLLQTYYPDHPMLNTLISKGYHCFAEQVLQERKLAQLPPFSAHAVIRAEANTLSKVNNLLEQIVRLGKSMILSGQLSIIGPFPAAMIKKSGLSRAIVLFEAPSKERLQKAMTELLNQPGIKKLPKDVRWHLDVDPLETF